MTIPLPALYALLIAVTSGLVGCFAVIASVEAAPIDRFQ